MSLKVRNYSVVVGVPLEIALQQATNEDVQHVFTFVDAPAPLGTGQPIDLTGLASLKLTIKDPNGQVVAQADAAVIDPTAGKAGFTILHAAIATAAQQAYKADALLVDGAAKQNQLLISTPFLILAGIT